MNTGNSSRRQFLLGSVSGLSSAWLAVRWPAILAAQEHAQRAAESGQPAQFQFFSPQEAVEIEAVAAQIIPSDDAPGGARRKSSISSITSWSHSTAISSLHTRRASKICDTGRRSFFPARTDFHL